MSDERHMARALELARSVLGGTAPNPAVGAVIVRGDDVLGEGATRPAGGPHAEVVALRSAAAAGHDVEGSTLYTTLEPCCHHGRTPPCTGAILDAGIGRVVIGTVDPFPQVDGRGIELLREAGVEVVLGVLRDESERQIRGFARAVRHGLPEVTAKVAMSLDGHLSTASGESQWITGELAREHGHRLRATHDAILVGIETVLADDPRLTARVEGASSQPRPVILDASLRTPVDARVFAHPRPPLLLCAPGAAGSRGLGERAEVVEVHRGEDGLLDTRACLAACAARGLHRVFVEGGARVHRSILDAGLVDTLHLYLGAVAIPGGRSWLGGPPLQHLADAHRLRLRSTEALGGDAHMVYEREEG